MVVVCEATAELLSAMAEPERVARVLPPLLTRVAAVLHDDSASIALSRRM